jgi:hypothetical protein
MLLKVDRYFDGVMHPDISCLTAIIIKKQHFECLQLKKRGIDYPGKAS